MPALKNRGALSCAAFRWAKSASTSGMRLLVARASRAALLLYVLLTAAAPMDESAARLDEPDASCVDAPPAPELQSATTTIVEVAAPRIALQDKKFSCLEDPIAAPSEVSSNGCTCSGRC